jgi:hypothetical protein
MTGSENAPAEAPPRPKYRWYYIVGAIVFSILSFELGVFLVVFPWLGLWDNNYFSSLSPAWRDLWQSPYCRGAVSGLGLVNVYIGLGEVFRLRRFAGGASEVK